MPHASKKGWEIWNSARASTLAFSIYSRRAANSIAKLVFAFSASTSLWVSFANALVLVVSSWLRVWMTSEYWACSLFSNSWRLRNRRVTPSLTTHLSWRAFMHTNAWDKAWQLKSGGNFLKYNVNDGDIPLTGRRGQKPPSPLKSVHHRDPCPSPWWLRRRSQLYSPYERPAFGWSRGPRVTSPLPIIKPFLALWQRRGGDDGAFCCFSPINWPGPFLDGRSSLALFFLLNVALGATLGADPDAYSCCLRAAVNFLTSAFYLLASISETKNKERWW